MILTLKNNTKILKIIVIGIFLSLFIYNHINCDIENHNVNTVNTDISFLEPKSAFSEPDFDSPYVEFNDTLGDIAVTNNVSFNPIVYGYAGYDAFDLSGVRFYSETESYVLTIFRSSFCGTPTLNDNFTCHIYGYDVIGDLIFHSMTIIELVTTGEIDVFIESFATYYYNELGENSTGCWYGSWDGFYTVFGCGSFSPYFYDNDYDDIVDIKVLSYSNRTVISGQRYLLEVMPNSDFDPIFIETTTSMTTTTSTTTTTIPIDDINDIENSYIWIIYPIISVGFVLGVYYYYTKSYSCKLEQNFEKSRCKKYNLKNNTL
ncbi:MAG: hypothetical protein WC934_06320 [Acidithiobacillus sp.]|jgi:hypothetical protein|uniref:hypothetical protein n=1 Tax=Acidithiobacillus sp. TaxID=1872118 RepID=UPI003560EFCB